MTSNGKRIAIISLIFAALLGAVVIVAKSPGPSDQDTPASYGH
jgi:hypothetical protein